MIVVASSRSSDRKMESFARQRVNYLRVGKAMTLASPHTSVRILRAANVQDIGSIGVGEDDTGFRARGRFNGRVERFTRGGVLEGIISKILPLG